MNKKFVFSMWTYNNISEFTPDEIETWVDLGMTIPMLPSADIDRDDPSILIPWLDKAKELGVQVIVNYGGMGYDECRRLGPEKYEAKIKPLYDALGGHPAVHGFCIGDEPDNKEDLEASAETLRINKKLAPHLDPFLNYTGAIADFDNERLGGRDLSGWMRYAYEKSGAREICYDSYSQAVNDGGGKTAHLRATAKLVEAAKAADRSEIWGCLLSSAHHVYSPQTEVDYRWQIHTAAALGLRGVLWFRLYDRITAIGYYGSPIDEFGTKTEGYYGLRRCQRRFSANYGEIFMRINHKKTYAVKSDRGVFPEFGPGCHDVIENIKANDETIISFFDGEDGYEYMCVVDSETRFYGMLEFYYDREKYALYDVTMNGASESPVRGENGSEISIIPAGLQLYKIVRK